MKKVEEEFKMGLDAQKSFAQMYEDRYMKKLDSIIIQESRKEIRAGKT